MSFVSLSQVTHNSGRKNPARPQCAMKVIGHKPRRVSSQKTVSFPATALHSPVDAQPDITNHLIYKERKEKKKKKRGTCQSTCCTFCQLCILYVTAGLEHYFEAIRKQVRSGLQVCPFVITTLPLLHLQQLTACAYRGR